MSGGWRRFGLYLVAIVALVGLVFVATRGETRTTGLVFAQVGFIAGMAYLVTFIVWPRRVPQSSSHPSKRMRSVIPNEPRPEFDRRPVAVIGNRPAGSEPGSRVHVPEAPTSRGTRGRRPDDRPPVGEMRWPAQR